MKLIVDLEKAGEQVRVTARPGMLTGSRAGWGSAKEHLTGNDPVLIAYAEDEAAALQLVASSGVMNAVREHEAAILLEKEREAREAAQEDDA